MRMRNKAVYEFLCFLIPVKRKRPVIFENICECIETK